MLHLKQFKKTYGPTEIISVNELQLQPGIYWLKGTNGSGKTTLMRSIAGMIPFEGLIEVGGVSIKQDRIRYTSSVNYAEAEPIFPGFLTGNDLINFYRETKPTTEASIEQLTEVFGTHLFSANRIATYSSGMTKKLSLVLAFMGTTKLILLDEPLITLDTATVENLRTVIREKLNEGVSFLITSHQDIGLSDTPMQTLEVLNKTLAQA
jgi:ABC-2 type transport system ATP-binding protein